MKLAENETVGYIIDREEDDMRKANDMRNMGIEEGKKEEKMKIAKAMKKIGASIEEINICTELTKEEIEKLDER